MRFGSRTAPQRIKAFIDCCGYPERVELLPYHAVGEHKYGAIGMTVKKFSIPGAEDMERLKSIF